MIWCKVSDTPCLGLHRSSEENQKGLPQQKNSNDKDKNHYVFRRLARGPQFAVGACPNTTGQGRIHTHLKAIYRNQEKKKKKVRAVNLGTTIFSLSRGSGVLFIATET